MDHDMPVPRKRPSGLFSENFYWAFRALFRPITRLLVWLHITPNMVTVFSMVLGILAGYYFAVDRLWTGLMYGYLMAFSDIVDGQLAKEHGQMSRFGGILDSIIDRYNEFFIFAGLAIRYLHLGRIWWATVTVLVFLNSIMTSYTKARAEADDVDCNVGWLQRPERLTVLAIGVAFNGLLLDPAIALLAIVTPATVLQRILHVRRQTNNADSTTV